MAPDNTIICPIVFASKYLTGVECRYSNIKWEALGILHGLEKFHHYWFARKVLNTTEHKLLVVIFKKDMAMLLQCIQCILLKIHQYRVQIIYKPWPKIFTADWLSQHNHEEGKDKAIKDMDIRIDTIQLWQKYQNVCPYHKYNKHPHRMTIYNVLKALFISGWLSTKDKLPSDLRPHWSYRDDLSAIDGVVIKGRQILTPSSLKQQVLDQLHTNHMGIEKIKLLAWKSVHWADINTNIEKHIKNCTTCLEFQQTQPKEKIILHVIPLRPWEVLRADIFHFNNKNFLCLVDYHSKFPVLKRLERLSVENLIITVSHSVYYCLCMTGCQVKLEAKTDTKHRWI